VEKCGRTRQVTDDDIIRPMRFACWMAKAADTRLEYAILNCVSMTTMVSRTRLNVTFTRTLSVMLIIVFVIN
jgi:acyl-coenzyme A thioesterase PaaI-like protein